MACQDRLWLEALEQQAAVVDVLVVVVDAQPLVLELSGATASSLKSA
jgi:hypothetical protein